MKSILQISTVLLLIRLVCSAGYAQGADPAVLYSTQARSLAQQGKYLEAAEMYAKSAATEKARPGQRAAILIASLGQAGICYANAGMSGEAIGYGEECLKTAKAIYGLVHSQVAIAAGNLAGFYEKDGAFEKAEPLFRQSLDIIKELYGQYAPETIVPMINLAIHYQKQGNYAEADQLYSGTLIIAREAYGERHPRVAEAMANLGSVYMETGRFDEALDLHEKALEIRENALGADHPDVAASLNDIALIYLTLGKHAQSDDALRTAEEFLQRSIAIYEKAYGEDHPDLGTFLNNLASIRKRLGDPGEAATLYQRALLIKEKNLGTDHLSVATTLNNLALLYMDQGRCAEADSLYRRSLAIFEKQQGENHPNVANALHNLAMAQVPCNRPDLALSLMRRALAVDERAMDNVFSEASEHEKSVFLGTIAYKLDVLLSLVVQEFRTDQQAVVAALDAALRRKGLILDALARERLALIGSQDSLVAVTVEDYQNTASRLASLVLAGPRALTPEVYRNKLDEIKAAKNLAEKKLALLAKIKSTTAAGEDRTVDAAQVAGSMKPGSVLIEYVDVRMTDFSSKSTDDEWTGYRYLAFVLPAGQKAEPVLVDLGEADAIDGAVRAFRREIAQFAQGGSSGSEADAERRLAEIGRQIYDLVFAPLSSFVGAANELYVSPDGLLNLIPMGVLPAAEDRYLIEAYQLDYLSSGRDLVRRESPPTSGKEVVVLADPDFDLRRAGGSTQSPVEIVSGDSFISDGGSLGQVEWPPLPGTRREAQTIDAAMQGKKVKIYLGDQALEDVVKKVKSPRILHLATHGFFLQEEQSSADSGNAQSTRGLKVATPRPAIESALEPAALPASIEFTTESATVPAPGEIENPLLRSGLVFAGANWSERSVSDDGGSDGILTALEVSGIPLSGTDLVVLSACETGLGDVTRGEGVFGLRRAFQLAGAKTVVMSLWSVPDEETAILMQGFYQRLSANTGKSQSLRDATLALMGVLRERKQAAHPFYWGAFVSVGEP